MFTEQADVDAMVEALRLSREFHDQEPLRKVLARELRPGPDVRTHAQIVEHIRQNAEHRHHPLGTCRMGVAGDAGAVVDAQLRVHGIENLRVADASVMPDDPTGNTNIPTIMIGEKASDMLRGRALPAATIPR